MPAYKLYTDQDSGDEYVTIYQNDGSVLAATNTHPRFNELKDLLLTGNPNDVDLDSILSPAKQIAVEFAKIGDELSIRGGELFYEGELLSGVLADKIIDLYEEGEDYAPFVLFLEKLKTNPVVDSIDNLYRFLSAGDFVIADDGDFIAYKGLSSESKSIHYGAVIRNGEPFEGNVPNVPGDVIEMDRGEVTWNPDVACGQGLHAGTWSYASGFGRVVVKVKINPKYVVSVPTDSHDQKVRVCRYTVVEQVEGRLSGSYDRGYVDYYDDDDLEDDDYDDKIATDYELYPVDKSDIDPGDIKMTLVNFEAVPNSDEEVDVEVEEVPEDKSEIHFAVNKNRSGKRSFWGNLGF